MGTARRVAGRRWRLRLSAGGWITGEALLGVEIGVGWNGRSFWGFDTVIYSKIWGLRLLISVLEEAQNYTSPELGKTYRSDPPRA